MSDRGVVPRLSGASLSWRAALTIALLIAVTLGTARGNDEWWPFAPMSQYAFLVKNDGVINSIYMEALTVDGDLVRVPLSPTGLGLERAEVEGQLPRFIKTPRLLQAIAVLRVRVQPDQPRYAEIFLRNRQTVLDADRTEKIIDLAHWRVVDPDDPEAFDIGDVP
ncbi:MAG: hypothetical protein V9G19_06070 [Tetrasphaera sp.]